MDIFQLQVMWLIGLVIFYIFPIIHISITKKVDMWEKTGWIILTLVFGLFSYAVFLIMTHRKAKNEESC